MTTERSNDGALAESLKALDLEADDFVRDSEDMDDDGDYRAEIQAFKLYRLLTSRWT